MITKRLPLFLIPLTFLANSLNGQLTEPVIDVNTFASLEVKASNEVAFKKFGREQDEYILKRNRNQCGNENSIILQKSVGEATLELSLSDKTERLIDTTYYNGIKYFITISTDFIPNTVTSNIWLRASKETTSTNDIHIMEIKSEFGYYQDYFEKDVAPYICRSKELLEQGKTIIGCGSVIGSGICVTQMANPLTAFICTATIKYAETGILDCIEGIKDNIAKIAGLEDEHAAFKLISNLENNTMADIFFSIVDKACSDLDKNKDKINGENGPKSEQITKPETIKQETKTDHGDRAHDKQIDRIDKSIAKAEKEAKEKQEKAEREALEKIEKAAKELRDKKDKAEIEKARILREPAGKFDK